MRIEIVREIGDLRREIWSFCLIVDFSGRGKIYFDSWAFQSKESKRHKWKTQSHWTRLMRRDNTVDNPPLPGDVVVELREMLSDKVNTLEITK
ncbi:hypothetical protein LCGC14_1889710 [marine sediment metagenome]|uniref:Uncharacterized protein n=1 Tax=marine sediment metagenome TaxID=412755 RepID=A0A0F9IY22_9ZZZZ